MSSRTIRSSSPNSASASARASSVLPTPVGPRNRKLPIGRSGSPRPARERRTASATTLDRLVLPDHPLVQVLLQAEQPLPLLLGELADRDAGGPGHHLGDVLDADLGDAGPSPPPLPGLLEPLPAASATWSRSPVARSYCSAATAWSLSRCSRSTSRSRLAQVGGEASATRQPHPGPGLVDQVDRLVGQEPVGDVAVGELHGRDQRLVGEPDLVVGLVPVAQAAQDLAPCPRRSARAPGSAGTGAPARRPSRCCGGTRRASWRR